MVKIAAVLASLLLLSGCVASAQAAPVEAEAVQVERAAVGRYSTPESAAVVPVVAAPVQAGDVVCEGQEIADRGADLAAWTEIRALRDAGLPACEVTWGFYSMPDGEPLGYAPCDAGAASVALSGEWGKYAERNEDYPWVIRGYVRHEFGHALTCMAGLDEAELLAMFPGETLTHSTEDTLPGHEFSAEAVEAVLAEAAGELPDPAYVDSITPAGMDAARALLDSAKE